MACMASEPVVWNTRGDRSNSGSGVLPTSSFFRLLSPQASQCELVVYAPFVHASLLSLCPESHTFPGLQASRELPVDDTIECVLERALLHAGFIAPANYGDLFKVWGRRASLGLRVGGEGTAGEWQAHAGFIASHRNRPR